MAGICDFSFDSLSIQEINGWCRWGGGWKGSLRDQPPPPLGIPGRNCKGTLTIRNLSLKSVQHDIFGDPPATENPSDAPDK